MNKRILTCAVLGNFTSRTMNPNLPITPAEIASDCLAAAEEGAAIVHVHVRDPGTELPSMEVAHYSEVVSRIRDANSDLIINLTTGNGGRFDPTEGDPVKPGPKTNLLPPEQRVLHVQKIKPDIATLDLNTMVFGGEVVINSPASIRRMGELIMAAGSKPEIELFDSGDIALLKALQKDGNLPAAPLCSIVMGVKFGFAPSPETVLYARGLLPPGAQWTAFGTGRFAFPMVAQSLLAGGHVRIGLEDATKLDANTIAPSNAAMVAKARRMMEDLGHPPMIPVEARKILAL
ncbi:3-keto-5-aminohexanoate cleavage protein [Aquicoccus porphyridii]|uniref:3-keto-5-aminohexanoate cleavage protein n=1 Tax=Aquicoccus porphyridii TaxID=1852029 RepID=A0A5A9YYS1_9RHOB|nr:3-keto-5-aminohexanoate cleavage protein [Aquicoccus porphyridii]KAA0910009.1 3-keto-5-aminohexanoate cleavage protein [Aquicoccus porphyridii]RAI52123.1 3-keto-5-aminohexanoate cleavage protein [Rhodobacteraceae bacterium AsT-22]